MKVSAATTPPNPVDYGGISSQRAIIYYGMAYTHHHKYSPTSSSLEINISTTNGGLSPKQTTFDATEKSHDNFYDTYVSATTQDQREEVVKQFITKLSDNSVSTFNPNYENGLFFTRAAERGDLLFLRWLVACSEDSIDLFEILMLAADRGHLECVKFFIEEKGMDPNSLVGYGAYNNHMHIKQFLDAKREELKKESPRKMVQEIGTLIEHIEQEPTSAPNALQEGIQDIVKKHLADGPIEVIVTAIIKILQEYSNDKTTGKEQRDASLLGGIATITFLMGLHYLEKKIPTSPNPSSFV